MKFFEKIGISETVTGTQNLDLNCLFVPGRNMMEQNVGQCG